jgi:secreted trypsin-like serine protease
MTKSIKIIFLAVLMFLTYFGGIIRHDVKKKLYLQLAKEKQFDCVGEVYRDSTFSGSCVLIGKSYILTAAHIFIESDFRPDTLKINGQSVIVNQPYNKRVGDIIRYTFKIKGEKKEGDVLFIHPDYLATHYMGSCDLALIRLKDPVTDIKQAILNTSTNELTSKVVGVGFGATGVANDPGSVTGKGEKLAGENVVDSIGGDSYEGNGTRMYCDFDHPTDKSCNKLGSPIPEKLEYTISGGDSGGGLFRKVSGSWQLIGICSQGDLNIQQFMKTGYYGQIMSWTRVSAFNKWIKEQLK